MNGRLPQACRTPEQLRGWLHALARPLGFDGALYLHIGHWSGTPAVSGWARAARFLSTADAAASADRDGLTSAGLFAAVRATFAPFSWPAPGDTGAFGDASLIVPVQDHAAGPAYVAFFAPDRARRRHAAAAEICFEAARFHHCAKSLLKSSERDHAATALTRREIECLRLAALGRTVIETGRFLGVTARTVEFHLKNAAEKLGATTKVRAVAVAVGGGLIQL